MTRFCSRRNAEPASNRPRFHVTEIGRAVRSAAGGAGGDIRTKCDTIVFAGGSPGFDASHGRLDAQFAFLGERRLTHASRSTDATVRIFRTIRFVPPLSEFASSRGDGSTRGATDAAAFILVESQRIGRARFVRKKRTTANRNWIIPDHRTRETIAKNGTFRPVLIKLGAPFTQTSTAIRRNRLTRGSLAGSCHVSHVGRVVFAYEWNSFTRGIGETMPRRSPVWIRGTRQNPFDHRSRKLEGSFSTESRSDPFLRLIHTRIELVIG